MDLNISLAFKNGLKKTFTKNGLILISILAGSIALYISGLASIVSKEDPSVLTPFYDPLIVSLPTSALVGISLLGVITAIIGVIGSIRILQDERPIGLEVFSDNLLYTFANLLVGTIIFLLVITAGWILFIVPGLLLTGILVYWIFFVVSEGQNFYEAFKNSWDITESNIFKSTGLIIAIILFETAFELIISGLVPVPESGLNILFYTLFRLLASGFMAVYTIAVLADAYNQLEY